VKFWVKEVYKVKFDAFVYADSEEEARELIQAGEAEVDFDNTGNFEYLLTDWNTLRAEDETRAALDEYIWEDET
jgi:hypothetical protein